MTLELTLALLALLITPGPTNALLALAGAQRGIAGGLRLIPVVVICYLCIVTPLLVWGGQMLERLPILRPVLTGLAALWVARLAFRLWHLSSGSSLASGKVSAADMAITTLLNPKSLIFGLVLLPTANSAWQALLGFTLLVPLISTLWAGLGAGILARSGSWLNRGSAIWLAALSLLLAAKTLTG